MIKAKDIKIGNLLEHNGEIVHVTSTSLDIDDEYQPTIGVCKYGANSNEVIGSEEEFNPIPLTAEWLLEMFGAVPLEIGYRLSERLALCKNLHRDTSGDYDGFNVMVKIGLDFRVLVGVPPIRYVHDLQNFYRWHTGEELNVKL